MGPNVLESRALDAHKVAIGLAVGRSEEAASNGLVSLLGRCLVQSVGAVGIGIERDKHLAGAITVVVVDRNARLVDRKLLKVRPAVAVELRVEVREETPLEERILAEVDAANDVPGLELQTLERNHRGYCFTYHDLLGLSKVVARVAVESHLANLGQGDVFLRDDLGRVKKIEAEAQLIFLVHDLHGKLSGQPFLSNNAA